MRELPLIKNSQYIRKNKYFQIFNHMLAQITENIEDICEINQITLVGKSTA